jgi:putative hemolysin
LVSVSLNADLISLVLLLAISAFFSASEAAFLAVSRTRVRHLREGKQWGGRPLSLLHRQRPLVLTVLLLGVTLSHYTAERIATDLSVQYLSPEWGPALAVVVMTIIIVVVCEVVPIQIGAHAAESVARLTSYVVAPVALLLMPVVLLLSLLSRLALYIFGVRTGSLLPGVSEEHLKAMIEQSEEQGVLEAGERRMMHGALDFGDRTAAQIMTPRPDMVCVAADETLGAALQLGLAEHHSRLPVYEDNTDNIIGVLHLKDMLPYLLQGEMDTPARVAARAAHHVPEALPADVLLAQLQRRHSMLAVVKDEYGGTAGLVTVEDLVEEIVGEIRDEYDLDESEVVVVSAHELLCDARVSLHELENYLREELPSADYDSLGGLVMDLAGRIPQTGEEFHYGRLTLRIEAVSGPRLERIRVSWPPVTASGVTDV